MQSNISQFLEVFKTAISGDENFREDVCEIVLQKTKFSLEKKCVLCKNGILYIKTDPYMKTEILMQKNTILEDIQNKYPKKNIREIL